MKLTQWMMTYFVEPVPFGDGISKYLEISNISSGPMKDSLFNLSDWSAEESCGCIYLRPKA